MKLSTTFYSLALSCVLASTGFAAGEEAKTGCEGAGPQAPRDISSKSGTNTTMFNFAPSTAKLNLCNIHFHKNAEHKGPGYSIDAGEGKHGGWKCNDTTNLTGDELKPFTGKAACTNIQPGDTIEIHWVHTSCDIKPGPTLGACLSKTCGNPQLRVEGRTFVLVNDRSALQLGDFDKGDKKKRGYWQAKAIPEVGKNVRYTGSTTGPSFTGKNCSPYQVSWSQGSSCAKLDIASVHKWCENNAFNEDHAHGVRMIVKNKKLLSPIH